MELPIYIRTYVDPDANIDRLLAVEATTVMLLCTFAVNYLTRKVAPFTAIIAGVQQRVEDFQATYRTTGQPRDFVTRAELLDADGDPVEEVEIRVNHPAELGGVKFYQWGYGWAPVIRVEQDGVPIADGPVVCQQDVPPEDVSPLQLPWNCVVKLPTLDPQVGIRCELWPARPGLLALLETGRAMPMLVRYAPVMTFEAFEGDLRAELVQDASALDTVAMRRFETGVLGAGETADLGDGLTVTFPELRLYTVLSARASASRTAVTIGAIRMAGRIQLRAAGWCRCTRMASLSAFDGGTLTRGSTGELVGALTLDTMREVLGVAPFTRRGV